MVRTSRLRWVIGLGVISIATANLAYGADPTDAAKAELSAIVQAAQKGDLPGALPRLTQLIDANPTWDDAIHVRAQVKAATKDLPGAEADWAAVLGRHPQDTTLLLERASARFDAGHLDDALADMTAALAVQPENPQLLVGRARVLAAKKDFAGAAKDLSLAVTKQPPAEQAGTFGMLAEVKATGGDAAGAEQILTDAIAAGSPQLLVMRAKLRAGLGRFDVARLDATAAIEKVSGNDRMQVLALRGQIAQAAKDIPHALIDFADLLRESAGNPQLEAVLVDLVNAAAPTPEEGFSGKITPLVPWDNAISAREKDIRKLQYQIGLTVTEKDRVAALAAQRAGNWKEALDAWTRVISAYPAAFAYQGRAYAKWKLQADDAGALRDYQLALALQSVDLSRDIEPFAALGSIDTRQVSWIGYLQRKIAGKPNELDQAFAAGQEAERRGSPVAAHEAYEHARDKWLHYEPAFDADNKLTDSKSESFAKIVDAYRSEAESALSAGDKSAASAAAEKLVHLTMYGRPDGYDVKLRLTRLNGDAKQIARAEEELKKTMGLSPTLHTDLALAAKDDATRVVEYNLAAGGHETADCRFAPEKSAATKRDAIEAKLGVARAGQAYIDAFGKLSEANEAAVALVTRLVQFEPKNASFRAARANTYARLSPVAENRLALEEYQTLRKLKPDSKIDEPLGDIEAALEDYAAAEQAYTAAIAANETPGLHIKRAGVRVKLERFADALQDFDAATAKGLTLAWPGLLQRADAKAGVGNYSSAIEDCNAALKAQDGLASNPLPIRAKMFVFERQAHPAK